MKKLTFLMGISAFILAPLLSFAEPVYSSYAPATQSQINWQPDYNTAVSLARSSSKPIIILFTGTHWCPACMKLERDVLTKPQFAEAVGDKFIFLKAEFPNYTAESIRASPFKFLLDRYQVDSFPTIIVINPDGQTLFNVNYQPGGIEAYVNELLGKLHQMRNTPPSPNFR